jgi:asparagine synthase (glutamine-hydrolysing)
VCGIVGVWDRTDHDPGQERARVCAAMAALRHRGPDDEGVWQSGDGEVALGHRRLSIIDVSASGHQPMVSADGRYTLSYNGEIYNFRDLRAELESAGHRFASHSDSEVLLEGYARWGREVVDRLVGMFAFAIWDERERTLFLARDRAGEKPLYYADGGAKFAFASELQALTEVPWVDTAIDADAVALFLEHQYVPAPLTIYRGARKLPPGHAMVVDAKGVRTWRYWDPLPLVLQPPEPLGEDAALEQFSWLLERAVREQMVSDVPLGAFLSGGIDSSAVVATMTGLGAARVKTFTIGFDVAAMDESEHAGRVAAYLGTDHTTEHLSARDALDRVPAIPELYGEPFADASALPTQLVSAVARRSVTVSLSGDGGDELFGGYGRYGHFERFAGLERRLGPLAGAAGELLRFAPGRVGYVADLLRAAHGSDLYHPFVSVFRRRDVQALTGRPFPGFEPYERVWSAAAGLAPRRRAMITDLHTYLPEAVLTKVDRAAMSVSLESRAPMLDHRIMEWTMRLPAPLVRDKALLKTYAFGKVPRELLERPKMGFGVPLSTWFRTELRDLVHDSLVPSRLEPLGIVGGESVDRFVAEHMSGRQDHGSRLWALLVLSMWGAARAR